jgi:hypothetical protein
MVCDAIFFTAAHVGLPANRDPRTLTQKRSYLVAPKGLLGMTLVVGWDLVSRLWNLHFTGDCSLRDLIFQNCDYVPLQMPKRPDYYLQTT